MRRTRRVFVHAGTYQPRAKGQALIWFNARHDGITLQAVGDVTLTAANPQIADPRTPVIRRSSTTSSISATASRPRP